jgi:hypothetical protein
MTEASQLGPSMDGTVMLDIGGDIGALIILTGEALHLAEIEISPEGADARLHTHAHSHDGGTHEHEHGAARTHVAVRERRGPSGVRYAAIYPGLRQGRYTVWGLDGAARDTVEIVGGEVRQVDWR